jgi:hypothetical protein
VQDASRGGNILIQDRFLGCKLDNVAVYNSAKLSISKRFGQVSWAVHPRDAIVGLPRDKGEIRRPR